MKMEEASAAAQERWQEVINHKINIADAEADEVDEGFVVLTLDPEDADTWGLYPVLSISASGTVAEYNVSQPFHYPTFADLMKAAAVRTASS